MKVFYTYRRPFLLFFGKEPLMGVKEEVLRTLRAESDAYISGQALADRLSVSRHAVWKAIDKLRS